MEVNMLAVEKILDRENEYIVLQVDENSPMTLLIKVKNGCFIGEGSIYFDNQSLLKFESDLQKCLNGEKNSVYVKDTDSVDYYLSLVKETQNSVIIKGKIGDYTERSLEFYFDNCKLDPCELKTKLLKIVDMIKSISNLN
jgi:hypothetical protein